MNFSGRSNRIPKIHYPDDSKFRTFKIPTNSKSRQTQNPERSKSRKPKISTDSKSRNFKNLKFVQFDYKYNQFHIYEYFSFSFLNLSEILSFGILFRDPLFCYSTPSYSNKHNVSLQYIVQFSKLLSKMWSISTNCFWVQIFKNLKFLKFEWKFRHQILGKIIKIIIQIYWQNLVPKFQPKFEIW